MYIPEVNLEVEPRSIPVSGSVDFQQRDRTWAWCVFCVVWSNAFLNNTHMKSGALSVAHNALQRSPSTAD
jgi:hypothetical protein